MKLPLYHFLHHQPHPERSSVVNIEYVWKFLNRKYYCFYDYFWGFKCNVSSNMEIAWIFTLKAVCAEAVNNRENTSWTFFFHEPNFFSFSHVFLFNFLWHSVILKKFYALQSTSNWTLSWRQSKPAISKFWSKENLLSVFFKYPSQ